MTTQDYIDSLTFVRGEGDYDKHQASIMSAAVAKWRLDHGEPLGDATDKLDCVCPVVRRLAVSINNMVWWKTDGERTNILKPLIDNLLNTKGSDELMCRRAYRCADVAVREFAASALRARGFESEAEELEKLDSIVDKQTAIDACASAADASSASDFASSASDFASSAAASAASAASTSAFAASESAFAASASANRHKSRDRCIELLLELCEMKDGTNSEKGD